MRTQYYQVTGRGPLAVDYPGGATKAHRPGQIFEAAPSNKAVKRGLRVGRVRKLSDREARALRAKAQVVVPVAITKPMVARGPDPIVIMDDPPKGSE